MPDHTIQFEAPAPGKVVAQRFHLVRPHRQGGLSVAFEATDELRGDACEVQFFSAGLFEGSEQAQAFAHSLAGWDELESPRVLRVRAIAVEGPNAYVATDMPKGESLRAAFDRRFAESPGFDADRVRTVGIELARALEDVHGKGLVHGDLKPSAVYVDGDSVVLVDGGCTPSLWTAKHLGERTALIGTPYYAPIEQFGGEAPDASSDLYNLSTLLFEMACGAQPWAGRTFLEVFQAKLAPEPPTIAGRAPKARVPKELEVALRRGLHADAKRRYPSATALRSALESLD